MRSSTTPLQQEVRMSPGRHWLAPALYMALLIALSSLPGASGPATPSAPVGWLPPIVSNALHVPLYAGLGFLLARTLALATRLHPWAAVLAAVVIAGAFGAADELYQGLIPGRTTAAADWLADAIGAAAGGLAYGRWSGRTRH